MAVIEKWESRPTRTGKQRGVDLIAIVTDCDDDQLAAAALLAWAPASYGELRRDPDTTCQIERIGCDEWQGVVHYVRQLPPKANLDTSGGTAKITKSIATKAYSASMAYPPPALNGAIGWKKDGEVEGVEVVVPKWEFQETWYKPEEDCTFTYFKTLFYMTGSVNDAPFRYLARGECLFLGAIGSYEAGDEEWEIQYKFSGSPNAAGLMIGDIGPIDKLGWEYLEVLYDDVEDLAAMQLIKQPICAFVHQVYPFSTFGNLGIGS